MTRFLDDHPIISLLMLSTVCTTIGRIIRPDAFKTATVNIGGNGKTVNVENPEENTAS